MGGRARPWEASEAAANNASDPSEPNTFHVHFLHQHLSHTHIVSHFLLYCIYAAVRWREELDRALP